MSSFQLPKKKERKKGIELRFLIFQIELGERYFNSHNLYSTLIPQNRLIKNPSKNSHTQKLTYFPGPYPTESCLKMKRQENYSCGWPIYLVQSKHVSCYLAANECHVHINKYVEGMQYLKPISTIKRCYFN